MIFLRRSHKGFNRFTWWRVGLFFLAAGIWLGGVAAGNDVATGVAIAVLFAAVILGLIGRRDSGEG